MWFDEEIKIEIQDKYLRADNNHRSKGAGGQHVNKTDSAVRLTYTLASVEPVVVAYQSDCLQHQNRRHGLTAHPP